MTLFVFGMGFTGQALGRLVLREGGRVMGTARSIEGCKSLVAQGFEAHLFNNEASGEGLLQALDTASHVLNSIPPDEQGDLVKRRHGNDLAQMQDLHWFGLLSTVGVYGEHEGGWVDEQTRPAPIAPRSILRLKAEREWLSWGREAGLKPHIFRLPGIYGEGRNQLVTVKRGKARRLVKRGQVFNRVHVDDIAQTLIASMRRSQAGHLFNIVDDEPAPPQDVVAYACRLLGVEPPPEVKFEDADLSPMARSFYGECKRVRNERIKDQLGIVLKYPTYRDGLKALFENM